MAKKKEEEGKDKKPLSKEELENKFDVSDSVDGDKKKKPVLYKEKKDWDIKKYIEENQKKIQYKPESFIPMSEAFQKLTGFPGLPQGHLHHIYGPSDVGKTTAVLECAKGAQSRNIFPIFVITEKKWSWSRAEKMGIDKNFLLFNDDISFIEDACDYIISQLDAQARGDLRSDIVILWDSLGATPSRAEWDAQKEHEIAVKKANEQGEDTSDLKKGSGGMMTAARVFRERIERTIQHKITATRRVDFPYFATLLMINHGYISPNPMGPPSFVHYGGEGIKYASAFQIRQGKVVGKPKKHTATKGGVDITWGLEVPFVFEKNHINGISREGTVIVTPYGYIESTKESIEKYKKEHREEWDSDFEQYYTTEEEDPETE